MSEIVCNRCVMSTKIKDVVIDEKGECNFCKDHDTMDKQHPTGEEGQRIIDKTVEKIKVDGKNKRHDCVIGISGGADSSYLLAKSKLDWGLNPLAVHFQNHWNTEIAEHNIRTMTNKLGVDFMQITVDDKEYNDINKSFILAEVPECDMNNDIGFTGALYRACDYVGVKYSLIAHSFRTEGVTPASLFYMDGKYIESVHKRYGTMPMKTYPNLLWNQWMDWMLTSEIERPRFLWYMDYNKMEAVDYLKSNFGWKWYGGSHLENKYTTFAPIWFYRKCGIDLRPHQLSAQVRSGFKTRQEALDIISSPPTIDPAIIDEIKFRLNIEDIDFDIIMNRPPQRTYLDFETYRNKFRASKDLFKRLLEQGRIPLTFYKKFVEQGY